MQSVKNVLSVLSAAALLASCNNVDFKKTKSGVPYKVYENKNGSKIQKGDFVKFEVIQKTKDTMLYSTYKMGMSQYIQVQPTQGTPPYMDIRSNLMEIIPTLRQGDSLYVVQSADSLLKQDPNAGKELHMKKGDQIETTVKIAKVFKTMEQAQSDYTQQRTAMAGQMEQQELERFRKDPQVQQQLQKDDQELKTYLTAHNISAEKTAWGTYVQILAPGSGPKPATGKFAMVRYTGSNLSGEVFDTNNKPGAPLAPFQVGVGGTIRGFDDGIRQLSKGAKARIFIPSALGYGPNGAPPRVKPNENLIFDVEVADITDTPPAPQMPIRPNTDSQTRK
jgi:FKBP-type peptidyl-prolyl cis-trans isomerase FkpA